MFWLQPMLQWILPQQPKVQVVVAFSSAPKVPKIYIIYNRTYNDPGVTQQ